MYRQFGTPKLITAVTLIAILAMAVRVPVSPDTWWHLRCGEVQWRERMVLKKDVFSHTVQGVPWVNQSWLPQLAMYGIHTVGGFPALAVTAALLVTIAFAFVLAAMPTEGRYGYFWRAFVVIVAAISTGRVWAARPHLITFVMTAVWAYILDRHCRRNNARIGNLWLLPLLMLLWANSHGGYIVGFVLLGTGIAGNIVDDLWHRRIQGMWARVRPMAIVALLCIPAVLLNPQGIRLALFPLQTLGSHAQQELISEWASPDFHPLDMLPFLALLLMTWSSLTFSGRKITGVEWLRLLGFTVMALRSGRYLGLCAVVAAPILFKHGQLAITRMGINWGKKPSIAPPSRGIPALNWALLIVLILLAGVKMIAPLTPQTISQVHKTIFPVDAVAYMRDADLPPPLFNQYEWGGYLIWTMYPTMPVFIDGRADPYGDALIQSYRQIITARPGWRDLLNEYRVRTALVATNSSLASAMRDCEEWQDVYTDELAAVFVRKQPVALWLTLTQIP